ncbi:MAG: tRNA 2-thiouridine(34) synthase MnmA [Deltaproteobacteria bacterium]|nr:tRNA 2-thiouridine(34) synthase MnmA [Deltaproteobacteria bacterium]
MSGKRVVVAMSGGVDSSTALAILKARGYDCIGVSMQLWDYSAKADPSGATSGSCCSLDDIADARAAADKVGVPFYVMNLESVFGSAVVDNFVAEYLSGRTPNPCVRCNQLLKFDALLKKAAAFEADCLATGHYARIEPHAGGWRLLKGVDPSKDQSYFLFTMTQAQLGRTLFPLGSLTKKEVREIARSCGLKTAEKAESQEICFVEDGDYAGFLAGRAATSPGDITDLSGNVIGGHKGLYNYTIGQRKGLGLSGGPYYVVGIDPAGNRLIVGPESALYAEGLVASGLNWIEDAARAELRDNALGPVTVKIRYRHDGAEAHITPDNASVRVRFHLPQRAVTPGQAVVFYRGDVVLGGGWIDRALE